jgi:hypothetical protein
MQSEMEQDGRTFEAFEAPCEPPTGVRERWLYIGRRVRRCGELGDRFLDAGGSFIDTPPLLLQGLQLVGVSYDVDVTRTDGRVTQIHRVALVVDEVDLDPRSVQWEQEDRDVYQGWARQSKAREGETSRLLVYEDHSECGRCGEHLEIEVCYACGSCPVCGVTLSKAVGVC